MSRLITSIENFNGRRICTRSEIVLADELKMFKEDTLRLAFVRHDYIGETSNFETSDVITVGGDTPAEFPLVEIPPQVVTLHQPRFDTCSTLHTDTELTHEHAERIWYDRRGHVVLVGLSLDGTYKAVNVRGCDPEFPCICRGAATTLILGYDTEKEAA